MKRETISLAFNGLEDTFISEAAEFSQLTRVAQVIGMNTSCSATSNFPYIFF